MFLVPGSTTHAREFTQESPESVSCYQKGQLILKTQKRIREFSPTSLMALIVDIDLGQVRETYIRMYVSEQADVVCVTRRQK